MITHNTVNIDKLKSLSSSNPKFKAIFEMYGKRLRGRQDSTVPRVRRLLKESGIDMSSSELSEFYREMHNAGAGRWVSGRNGKQGRFVWGFHLKSIADNVNGCKYNLDESRAKFFTDKKTGKQVIDREHSPYVTTPLEAMDIIRSTPKAKTRLPRLVYEKGVTQEQAPVALEMPHVEMTGVTTERTGKIITVRKAGFVMELPLAEMSGKDWEDAAKFMKSLDTMAG